MLIDTNESTVVYINLGNCLRPLGAQHLVTTLISTGALGNRLEIIHVN